MGAEVANADQAESWDGEPGRHWTAHDTTYTRVASRHTARLFERARIAAGERVLDVGCGSGTTACEAAALAAPGEVLGIDLSAELLALARRRAGDLGLANVAFEQGDAQVQPLPRESFEVAISRFGGMFFGDPVAAYRNLLGALSGGGRLAMLSWAPLEANEWIAESRRVLAAGASLSGGAGRSAGDVRALRGRADR